MFGSENLPLGPNGQFPRQRIKTAGNELIPGVSMQDTYLSGRNNAARLPITEKDFHSSLSKTKLRMRHGKVMRGGLRPVDMFRPRYAPKSNLGAEDDYHSMDDDDVYTAEQEDEGLVDDSVGAVRNARSTMMIGSRIVRSATGARRIVAATRAPVGSGGWLKGIQRLLGLVRR